MVGSCSSLFTTILDFILSKVLSTRNSRQCTFLIPPSFAGSIGKAFNPTKGSSMTLSSAFLMLALHSPEFSWLTFILLAIVNPLHHETSPDTFGMCVPAQISSHPTKLKILACISSLAWAISVSYSHRSLSQLFFSLSLQFIKPIPDGLSINISATLNLCPVLPQA